MNLQDLVDGWNARMQKERAGEQMTLGELIDVLSKISPDASVANLREPHSYRGYYCDIAFEQSKGTRPAGDLLADCRWAMGQIFEGYKGGGFMMGAGTPVWVAHYGCCGMKLMAVGDDGSIEVASDDY